MCSTREFAITNPEHYRLMFERMHEIEPGERGMLQARRLEQLVGERGGGEDAAPAWRRGEHKAHQ